MNKSNVKTELYLNERFENKYKKNGFQTLTNNKQQHFKKYILSWRTDLLKKIK